MPITRKKAFFRQATLVLLAMVLHIPNATAALDSASSRLIQKSVKKGSVSVIVTFKQDQANSDQASIFNKERNSNVNTTSLTRLNARQDVLLRKLKRADSLKVKKFTHVPQMALKVNQADLMILLQDSNLIVHEDVLHKPMLAESVPYIYPSVNSSTYHGNSNWTVALLDTGVDKTHPFLQGKVVSEACYSDGGGQPETTSLCPGGVTSSVQNNSALDCNLSIAGCGHGTYIAGIVAGNGLAFDGVAKDAKIIPIQVYSRVDDIDICFPNVSCVGAYSSDIILALERVYALRTSYNIAAANISLGAGLYTGTCDSQPEKTVIDLLKTAKIATVVASGNDGSNSQLSSPACISSAIAVGSSLDTSDTKSTFSNTGPVLDFYAPGQAIVSSVPGGGYSSAQGTSAAAAHVAGAWAVMKSKNFEASVDTIKNTFIATGANITHNVITKPRINLTAALDALPEPTPRSDDDICIPIKAKNNNIAIICL